MACVEDVAPCQYLYSGILELRPPTGEVKVVLILGFNSEAIKYWNATLGCPMGGLNSDMAHFPYGWVPLYVMPGLCGYRYTCLVHHTQPPYPAPPPPSRPPSARMDITKRGRKKIPGQFCQLFKRWSGFGVCGVEFVSSECPCTCVF